MSICLNLQCPPEGGLYNSFTAGRVPLALGGLRARHCARALSGRTGRAAPGRARPARIGGFLRRDERTRRD